MILHLHDDPKDVKKWLYIASSDLLKELENFMSTIIINGFGTNNGVLFVKPTGRQVDSSHRYYFYKVLARVRRADIYKFFKVYTNKEVEQHYEDAQVIIARERIQICLNVVHSGIDITHRKTIIDYTTDLFPEIIAVSTTATEEVAAAEHLSEKINDLPSPHSSLSSLATPVLSPPSNGRG
ncbi:unnamed protein product [Adineta steineri]|uniref:Uncharacterized protein n=1 Tax=Adineta steineri TaxID=433720 RepID=A0A813UXI8_9BILA|nr:unnamed protein product [Adineta steineri]CAF0829704.1 unnamed protein product [Adineta steineri]